MKHILGLLIFCSYGILLRNMLSCGPVDGPPPGSSLQGVSMQIYERFRSSFNCFEWNFTCFWWIFKVFGCFQIDLRPGAITRCAS